MSMRGILVRLRGATRGVATTARTLRARIEVTLRDGNKSLRDFAQCHRHSPVLGYDRLLTSACRPVGPTRLELFEAILKFCGTKSSGSLSTKVGNPKGAVQIRWSPD